MEKDSNEGQRPMRWFGLLELVRHCPRIVNGIKITAGPRLTLWCLAHHADGNTDRTFISLATIAEETGLDERTLKKAIHALKAAKLVSATQQIHDDGSWSTNNWKVNRDLLKTLAGDGINEAALEKALDAIRAGDAEVRVTTNPARMQQTRSKLYRLAGSLRIDVIEETVGEKYATLLIRPAVEAVNHTSDVSLPAGVIEEPEETATRAASWRKPAPSAPITTTAAAWRAAA